MDDAMMPNNPPAASDQPQPQQPDPDVQQVYQLSRRAAAARQQRETALLRGTTDDYFKAARNTPEHAYYQPLNAVRRQLSTLARERRAASDKGLDLHVEQLSAAMSQVARGTLMWLDEALGRAGGGQQQPAQGTQGTQAAPDGPDTAAAPASAPPQ